ncbi:hypothetical protein Q3H58_002805 [Pseudomonas psychrotolerans]|nr:hypothetical protein [Pseudomonas psychrotolerans]
MSLIRASAWCGSRPFGPGLFAGEGDLLLETRHADLEELVQVAGEDQQELEPLEQRIGFVEGLFQHPDVELQLRQLAMDIEAAVIHVGGRNGRHGRRLHHRRGLLRLAVQRDRFLGIAQGFGGGRLLQIGFDETLATH